MVREAEQHAAEDKRRRELIEARNQADGAIYAAEKQLHEHGEKAGEAQRKALEAAISSLREAVAGEDTARIRERIDGLSRALAQFDQALQDAAAGQAEHAAAADKPSAAGGDDVVDAEFEEVDDAEKRRRG
jgi:molecular chaperone DnaK